MESEHDISSTRNNTITGGRMTIRQHRLPPSRTKGSTERYQKRTLRDPKILTDISDNESSLLVLYATLLRQQDLACQKSNFGYPKQPKSRIRTWQPKRFSKLNSHSHRPTQQSTHRFQSSQISNINSSHNQQFSSIPTEVSDLTRRHEELFSRSTVEPSVIAPTAQRYQSELTNTDTKLNTKFTNSTNNLTIVSHSPLLEVADVKSDMPTLSQSNLEADMEDVQPFSFSNLGPSMKRTFGKRKSTNNDQVSECDNSDSAPGEKRSKECPSSLITNRKRSRNSDLKLSNHSQSTNTVHYSSNVKSEVAHSLSSVTSQDAISTVSTMAVMDPTSVKAADGHNSAIDVATELGIFDTHVPERFLSKLEEDRYVLESRMAELLSSQSSDSRMTTENLPNSKHNRRDTHLPSQNISIRQHRSMITEHTSSHDSPAPSPSTRKGGRNTTGKNRSSLTNGKGRTRGRGTNGGAGGGRDRGDSPDPPTKHILTAEERASMAHIRARQLELKRFFSMVAGQQREILDTLAARDLAKLMKKSKAHTKVPEYDQLCTEIDEKMQIAQDLAEIRLTIEKEHVEKAMSDEIRIIEEQFQSRIQEAKREHVKGAEGDLIIFKIAHRTAIDDTGTEAGSDTGTYPRYHECPEPDSRVRGYSSLKITDEKSLKQQLSTYDEQAQREVIDDDVVEPQNKSIAEYQAKKEQDDREQGKEMEDLVKIAEDELRGFQKEPPPPSVFAKENPQFALSRLADASELILRQMRDQNYAFVPPTPTNMVRSRAPSDAHLPPPPIMLQPIAPSVPLVKKPTPRRQKKASKDTKQVIQRDQTEITTSSTSSLPAIAPAPAKMPPPPPSPMHTLPRPPTLYPMTEYPLTPYGQNMSPLPPPPSGPQSAISPRRTSQQFTFTPAQTPGQQYFSPTTPTLPFLSGPAPVAIQGKMHNTFVNQTVESRHQADIARQNAARTQGQGMGPRGGKRILLPKV